MSTFSLTCVNLFKAEWDTARTKGRAQATGAAFVRGRPWGQHHDTACWLRVRPELPSCYNMVTPGEGKTGGQAVLTNHLLGDIAQ